MAAMAENGSIAMLRLLKYTHVIVSEIRTSDKILMCYSLRGSKL
jgi:hypothetical protein